MTRTSTTTAGVTKPTKTRRRARVHDRRAGRATGHGSVRFGVASIRSTGRGAQPWAAARWDGRWSGVNSHASSPGTSVVIVSHGLRRWPGETQLGFPIWIYSLLPPTLLSGRPPPTWPFADSEETTDRHNVSAVCVEFVRLWHQRGTTAVSVGPWPMVWFVSTSREARPSALHTRRSRRGGQATQRSPSANARMDDISETLGNLLADSVVLEEKRPQHLSHCYPLLNCLTFDPRM